MRFLLFNRSIYSYTFASEHCLCCIPRGIFIWLAFSNFPCDFFTWPRGWLRVPCLIGTYFNIPVFLMILISSFILWWNWSRYFVWFQSFYIYWDLFSGLISDLSWTMCQSYSRRICILLLLGGGFNICVVRHLYPYLSSVHFWKWGATVSNIYSRTFSLFNSIEKYSQCSKDSYNLLNGPK